MTAPVKEGDVLAGKYRIERVLGVGGMGVVVAALHMQLDQRVAIKFLLPAALENPDLVARFAREARAAARIQNEHVARVIDVGTLDSGSPYMVMEYLEGRDLSWVIHERGPLPLEEAAEYILQACEAIAEAHSAGIIHRDLKPANLFLAERPDREPTIKVLDFGISKATSKVGDELSLTKTTSLVGSPLYMSPEQMASAKDVDARCDVWALGVIFYELLAGATPFMSDSMTGIVAAILQNEPRHPNELRPDLPRDVVAIILRCLEKQPSRRFQNVGQLAAALVRFAPKSGRSSVARIARMLGTPVETSPTLLASQPPPAPSSISQPRSNANPSSNAAAAWGATHAGAEKAHRRGIAIGVGAALAIVLAMVAGGVIVMQINRTPAVAAPTAAPTPPPSASVAVTTAPSASATPAAPEHLADAETVAAPVDAAPNAAKPVAAGAARTSRPRAHTASSGSPAAAAQPAQHDPQLEIRLQR